MRGDASASDGDGGDALPGVSASGGGNGEDETPRRGRPSRRRRARRRGGERRAAAGGDGGRRNGVREADLKKMLEEEMTVQERAEAINELLNQRKIDIFGRGIRWCSRVRRGAGDQI